MTNQQYPQEIINVDGKEIAYHKINADQNGNPRYVVHFLTLGIEREDYGKVPKLTKYRAKWFAGGIVLQSHGLESDLRWHLEQVEEFYKAKEAKAVKKPQANLYVVMTDKFLSNWAHTHTEGKDNVLVFLCNTTEEAEIVEANGKARGDMVNVRTLTSKPCEDKTTQYMEFKTRADMPKMYKRGAFQG